MPNPVLAKKCRISKTGHDSHIVSAFVANESPNSGMYLSCVGYSQLSKTTDSGA